MNNKGKKPRLSATESGLRLGDFALGSLKSRALARALADCSGSSRNFGRAIIEVIGSSASDRSIFVPTALVGLRLRFQPKQWEFDRLVEHSNASWLGYGGSRGGAKSGGARRTMLRRRMEYPGTAGQIIRRTWDDVRKNHVEKFFTEFPQLLEHYNVSDHQVTIPTESGPPSSILFGYAENEKDVKRKSVGPEFMDIFVDQAEQFTENELKLIKTTCRWPHTPEHRCKFGLFFNPGGPGAAFLRRVFKTNEYHEREKVEDFAFIQAYGWDNVEWVREALNADGVTEDQYYYEWTEEQRFAYFITRSQYGRELDALPQAMRIGHLLGNFDKFAGQYFDIFDLAKHVKPCRRINEWEPRWLGIDWGFAHDAACYWNARDGQIVKTYREFVSSGFSPKALAQMIVDETPKDERPHISEIFLSHDAYSERTGTDTIALQMGEVFRANGWPDPVSSDRDVVGGAALLYEMLRSEMWQIDPSCVKLIECLPVVSRDEDDKEKTVKFEGDDPFDAVKYAMKGRLGEAPVPKELKIERQIEELKQAGTLTDPTSEMIWRAQLNQQAQRESQPVRFRFRRRGMM